MVNYIKDIAQEIATGELTNKEVLWLTECLAEELNRLDPRDFLPDAQVSFVKSRMDIRFYAKLNSIGSGDRLRRISNTIIGCLEKYGGEGSRAESRSFRFISDSDLRSIIERDYKELSLILLPGGAWKSCVVMTGSILEAILYDILTQKGTIKKRALESSQAPKNKSAKVLDIDKGEWSLNSLIMVAVDIGVLPGSRANAIDQILRDFRNFVHPKKEVRAAHPCTEAEAYMAKGALDSVCNHIDLTMSP